MDLLYIHKQEGDAEEFKYSLRSIAKNLVYQNGLKAYHRIFVAGDIPDWMNRDEVIWVSPKQYDWLDTDNRYMNSESKLLNACELSFMTENIIFFHDDFFVLEPIFEIPTTHRGTLSRSNIDNTYWHTIRHTRGLLEDLGVPHKLNYEVHQPMVINRAARLWLNKVLSHRMKRGEVFQMRSVYGNVFNIGGRRVEDCKNIDPEGQVFVSTDEKTFAGPLGDKIKKMFPDKSIYEK